MKKITILVPAYNEEENIKRVLEEIKKENRKSANVQKIFQTCRTT